MINSNSKHDTLFCCSISIPSGTGWPNEQGHEHEIRWNENIIIIIKSLDLSHTTARLAKNINITLGLLSTGMNFPINFFVSLKQMTGIASLDRRRRRRLFWLDQFHNLREIRWPRLFPSNTFIIAYVLLESNRCRLNSFIARYAPMTVIRYRAAMCFLIIIIFQLSRCISMRFILAANCVRCGMACIRTHQTERSIRCYSIMDNDGDKPHTPKKNPKRNY